MNRVVVVGFRVVGHAVAAALLARRIEVVAVDDHPGDLSRELAADLGLDLVAGPDDATLGRLVAGADAVVPAPGLPDRHPVFGLAEAAGVPVRSEFDLASEWDHRPCLAITGTNGKTTVTTLATQMLVASGVAAAAVGNIDLPLITAIEDPTTEVFVVEASSFQVAHSSRFRPAVGTWLNFAEDHLDVHASVRSYETAKARLWSGFDTGDRLAVANADDPVVMGHARGLPNVETFGTGGEADWRAHPDGRLSGPDGTTLATAAELWRSLPHDLANGLAATATATAAGASPAGTRTALLGFRGLPHRVELVGEAGGVRFYDDSKATAPHATVAAVEGFESVVLIAGGRNKGLDLASLALVESRLRAVVAIGEAGPVVAAVFGSGVPVRMADSMDEAVAAAAGLARAGDVVLLSPGCASFDWYRSYGERGDDFTRATRRLLDGAGASR